MLQNQDIVRLKASVTYECIFQHIVGRGMTELKMSENTFISYGYRSQTSKN